MSEPRSSEEEDDNPSDLVEKSEETHENIILKSYEGLSSRRVDLIGDYAGNELFLIDGDSLLLDCFSDSRLDFEHGFQMAHAVYIVENFLHHLEQRKCNFHIAFFESNKHLCTPQGVSDLHEPKFALARAVIIRHLQQHMRDKDSRLHRFSSITCDEFAQYLSATGLYFIMCHDGASPLNSRRRYKKQGQRTKSSFRAMITFFINRGYNVALVNGLEWRDTKVMTMVLEKGRRDKIPKAEQLTPPMATPPKVTIIPAVSAVIDTLSQYTTSGSKVTTERELLVIAVSILLMQQAAMAEDSKQSTERAVTVFLLHTVLMKSLPLSARHFVGGSSDSSTTAFLSNFAHAAASLLEDSQWPALVQNNLAISDLHDVVDGRLFVALSTLDEATVEQLPQEVRQAFREMLNIVSSVSSVHDLKESWSHKKVEAVSATKSPNGQLSNTCAVLPFSNAVFDKHLECIHLAEDNDADQDESVASARIFRELSHWHNSKRPLDPKSTASTANSLKVQKDKVWALKRNQWFMAEMQKYAASLTNSIGKSLEPETIGKGSGTATSVLTSAPSSTASLKENVTPPKKPAGKAASKAAEKQARMDALAASQAKRAAKTGDKSLDAWRITCSNLLTEQNLSTRYGLLEQYLASPALTKSKDLTAEVQLCMLSTLLEKWIQACRSHISRDPDAAAAIWNVCRNVLASPGLTKIICDMVELTISTLGLPPLSTEPGTTDRPLAFTFALPARSDVSLAIPTQSAKDFQLMHCGPYLDRSIDSAPDPRVEFQPDAWQRDVLDGIDANKSLFVVAPTSAGKTFISFYAMRKVLAADDDSVLVYVAPTKALVNQIAAEIQARYSKSFKYGGKSVWAIHTRDYRINNPTGCQILVTVPHVLQIMLLAPSNANSWSSRVKRIIFDEVHSIGNAEDGVIWEQLLLLAPCPIIALSATVGNPLEFYDWLSNTQAAMGYEVIMGGTTHRYSDLRKFKFTPPQRFAFQDLAEKPGFGKLGLDGADGFGFIHPVASLINKSRGMPDDLTLEPRDCFTLWSSMAKCQSKTHPVRDDCDVKHLPQFVTKKDIIQWQTRLKIVLNDWMSDASSPFDAVLNDLSSSFHDQEQQALQTSSSQGNVKIEGQCVETNDLLDTTLPLLCSLHEHGALPAILFNYDRIQCEGIAQKVVHQLQDAEKSFKETSVRWKATVKAAEEYNKNKAKQATKSARSAKSSSKAKGGDADDERISRLDQQRDAGDSEFNKLEGFDPDAVVEGFTFADKKKLLPSELDEFVWQLRKRGKIADWLIDGLQRGIGVHHAGMNRKYRQVVEILFRKGFLRVVIATGTLALGINMPCKTVVFSGDSVFLTALNFRQGAGRAGRRGFDLLGNVVFQNIPETKICRLLSSRLPDLNGHFPVTTSLVLRLFTLLHESKNSQYAVKAINSLLSQPRLYMGGAAFRDQTLHHLRFSIEYLRRQQLLNSKGATLNFAGLVSHLYFTENSSFAFHALLKEGYFHRLSANINEQERNTVEELMLVMAHLFGRLFSRQADQEYKETVVKPSSSIVFLPKLPKEASRILRKHADDTLQVFETYVESFVNQHVKYADNELPFTKVRVGAVSTSVDGQPATTNGADGKDADDLADDWDAEEDTPSDSTGISIPALDRLRAPPTKLRSQFVALSGHSDDFASISDLCRTVRSGVFLEQSVIPHVGSYPEELDSPLNAYLLDFFKHGDIATLERANRVRKSDVWFLLNDFSMILATIITSLMNFMKLKPSSDMDMLDVMGDADIFEEEEDDKLALAETDNSSSVSFTTSSSASDVVKVTINKKKAKNAESWEDEADEDEKKAARNKPRVKKPVSDDSDDSDAPAWEGEVGERGLLKVLKAFQVLQKQFNEKFHVIFA